MRAITIYGIKNCDAIKKARACSKEVKGVNRVFMT